MKEIMMIEGIGYFIGIVLGVQLIGLVSVSIYINKTIEDVVHKKGCEKSILVLPHKGINLMFRKVSEVMNLTI